MSAAAGVLPKACYRTPAKQVRNTTMSVSPKSGETDIVVSNIQKKRILETLSPDFLLQIVYPL